MTIACNMGSFLKLRKAINNLSKIRISVNDMLVKAIGLTNIDIPEGNQQWNGKTIRQFKDVDVSVAVATEQGLITPIVTKANEKTLTQIATKTKELITKARE